jgi:hypothetical protein
MDLPKQPSDEKRLRSFGYIVGGAFVALAALSLWREKTLLALVSGPVGLLLLVFGHFSPGSLSFVYKKWMGLSRVLGGIMTHVLMTLLFFTLLLPFTLMRFKDPLRLKWGEQSYWEPHKSSKPTLERFRRPF